MEAALERVVSDSQEQFNAHADQLANICHATTDLSLKISQVMNYLEARAKDQAPPTPPPPPPMMDPHQFDQLSRNGLSIHIASAL